MLSLGQPLIESLVTKQLRLNSNRIPDGHPGTNYWYPGGNPPTNYVYWHPGGNPGANYWHPGSNPGTNYGHLGHNPANYGPPGCNPGTYWYQPPDQRTNYRPPLVGGNPRTKNRPHADYQPPDQCTNYRPPLAGGNPSTKKRPPGSNPRTKNRRPGGNPPTNNRPVTPPLAPKPTVPNVISGPPPLRIPFKRKVLPTVEKLGLKEGLVYFVSREATVSHDYSSISEI